MPAIAVPSVERELLATLVPLLALAAHPRVSQEAADLMEALRTNALRDKACTHGTAVCGCADAAQYALTDKMLKPATAPEYFARIKQGMEMSLLGIARPWWKRFLGIW